MNYGRQPMRNNRTGVEDAMVLRYMLLSAKGWDGTGALFG